MLPVHFAQTVFLRRLCNIIYCLAFICSLIGYFSISARQDRDWAPEVSRELSYEQHGNLVTLHNVRNFNWRSENDYDEKWENNKQTLNFISYNICWL